MTRFGGARRRRARSARRSARAVLEDAAREAERVRSRPRPPPRRSSRPGRAEPPTQRTKPRPGGWRRRGNRDGGPGSAREGGGRRPTECGQVDADQHAARRGAADRIRSAGNDARFGRDRLRARPQAVHADRHRRRAPPRQGHRHDREVLGREDPAGDRGLQRLRADARCDARAWPTRTPTSPATSSRPGGRWWSRSTSGMLSTSRERERMKLDLDRKLQFLGFARRSLHFGDQGHGSRVADAFGRRCLHGGDAQAADAEADPRADRGGRAPAAAAHADRSARRCATPTRAGQNPPIIVIHGTSLDADLRDLPTLPGRHGSGRSSPSRARRCASSSVPAPIPTQSDRASGRRESAARRSRPTPGRAGPNGLGVY